MFTSLVLVTTMLLAQGASPFTERILIDHHKAIRLRDGVTVYADVYRPSREGRFPAIVVRTPYGVQREATGVHDRMISLARMGYAVVNVDVRGRYESEGTWDPFRAEAKDGYDVVEWAAKQPWTNGKVAMQGGSYLGHTQWATLGEAAAEPRGRVSCRGLHEPLRQLDHPGRRVPPRLQLRLGRCPDAVPDHAAAVVLHRSRRRARAALRAAADAPAARDDGRAGLSAPGEALA